MPMNRALYPSDWDAIATRIKTEAKWHCEQCGRPCRPPGVAWPVFAADLVSPWAEESYHVIDQRDEVVEKWGRFTLTVAHLDQNPANNDRANLKALCSPCHLRHDAIAHGQTRRRRRRERMEQEGQLRLEVW